MTPLMRMFWALFYKLLLSGISLLNSAITARYLGTAGRGHLTLTQTYQTIYSPVVGSFSEYIPYGINKRKESPQAAFSVSLVFWMLLTGPLFIAALVFTPWLLNGIGGIEPWVTRALWVLGVTAPFTMFHVYVTRLMWGMNELEWLNRLNTVQAFAFCLFLLVVLLIRPDKDADAATIYMVGAWALSYVAASMVSAFVIRKLRISIRPRLDANIRREMARFGALLIPANLINVLNNRIDLLIVYFGLSAASTGSYGIGVTVAEMLTLVASSILQVVLTRVSSLDEKDSTQLTARVFRHTGVIVLVSMMLMYLVMPWVMLIVFGQEYIPSIYNMLILLPGIALLGMSQVLTAFINNQLGRTKVTSMLFLASIFVNLLLSYLLMPHFGTQGTAVAKSAAYGTIFLASAVYFAKATGYPLRKLLRLQPEEIEQYRSVFAKIKAKINQQQKDQR